MEKRVRIAVIFLIIAFILCAYFAFEQFVFAQGGRIGLNIGHFQINFISPLNTTYNFSFGTFYNVTLNVSSNRNITSWRYTHIYNGSIIDGNGNIINGSIVFTPPILLYTKRGAHTIIINATDNYDNNGTNSISFYSNVINRAPIIEGLDERIFVCENKRLPDFGTPVPIFNITEPESETVDIDMVPSDPFYIGIFPDNPIINSTTGRYEIFSGILTKNDAGGINVGHKNYSETAYVSDSENIDSRLVNITVIEVNNAPVITTIGAKTLWTHGDNSSFNYVVHATDTEDGDETGGNIFFNISFMGENLFTILSGGIINFTANESYIGVHNITVCVRDLGILYPHQNISLCGQDGSSIATCINFSLTVTNQNRRPEFNNYFPKNLSFSSKSTDTLLFNVSTYDADGGYPDAYWYVDDELKGFNSGIDTGYGHNFSYYFGCGVGGEHNVSVIITDGELNNSLTWNVNLDLIGCPSKDVLPASGSGVSGKIACVEKWGCKEWLDCKNLKQAENSGNNVFGLISEIRERCSLFSWKDDICGFQTRSCKDVNKCGSNLTKPGIVRECYYTVNPTCFDRIKNCHNSSCEILADCGGPCKPCPTCSDNIRNQGEEGVDCGGPCTSCKEKETPGEKFDYMKIAIPALFLVIGLFIFIIIMLIRDYIKKKRHLAGINKPRKGF